MTHTPDPVNLSTGEGHAPESHGEPSENIWTFHEWDFGGHAIFPGVGL